MATSSMYHMSSDRPASIVSLGAEAAAAVGRRSRGGGPVSASLTSHLRHAADQSGRAGHDVAALAGPSRPRHDPTLRTSHGSEAERQYHQAMAQIECALSL